MLSRSCSACPIVCVHGCNPRLQRHKGSETDPEPRQLTYGQRLPFIASVDQHFPLPHRAGINGGLSGVPHPTLGSPHRTSDGRAYRNAAKCRPFEDTIFRVTAPCDYHHGPHNGVADDLPSTSDDTDDRPGSRSAPRSSPGSCNQGGSDGAERVRMRPRPRLPAGARRTWVHH